MLVLFFFLLLKKKKKNFNLVTNALIMYRVDLMNSFTIILLITIPGRGLFSAILRDKLFFTRVYGKSWKKLHIIENFATVHEELRCCYKLIIVDYPEDGLTTLLDKCCISICLSFFSTPTRSFVSRKQTDENVSKEGLLTKGLTEIEKCTLKFLAYLQCQIFLIPGGRTYCICYFKSSRLD